MKVEDLGEFKFQLDRIARYTNSGYQFWNARELQIVLQYSSWQRFESVIQRAMISCQSSGYNPTDHFNTGVKMVSLGSGSTRELTDYKISKYGCYLVAMNGDPAKKAGVIINKDKLYIYGDEPLGATDTAVIAWLKDPVNRKKVELIKREIDPEFGDTEGETDQNQQTTKDKKK
jgi:DNA-damage-inducible protein D